MERIFASRATSTPPQRLPADRHPNPPPSRIRKPSGSPPGMPKCALSRVRARWRVRRGRVGRREIRFESAEQSSPSRPGSTGPHRPLTAGRSLKDCEDQSRSHAQPACVRGVWESILIFFHSNRYSERSPLRPRRIRPPRCDSVVSAISSKCFQVLPDSSKCFHFLPNASKCFRQTPHRGRGGRKSSVVFAPALNADHLWFVMLVLALRSFASAGCRASGNTQIPVSPTSAWPLHLPLNGSTSLVVTSAEASRAANRRIAGADGDGFLPCALISAASNRNEGNGHGQETIPN
jgi:hypothetical protein